MDRISNSCLQLFYTDISLHLVPYMFLEVAKANLYDALNEEGLRIPSKAEQTSQFEQI